MRRPIYLEVGSFNMGDDKEEKELQPERGRKRRERWARFADREEKARKRSESADTDTGQTPTATFSIWSEARPSGSHMPRDIRNDADSLLDTGTATTSAKQRHPGVDASITAGVPATPLISLATVNSGPVTAAKLGGSDEESVGVIRNPAKGSCPEQSMSPRPGAVGGAFVHPGVIRPRVNTGCLDEGVGGSSSSLYERFMPSADLSHVLGANVSLSHAPSSVLLPDSGASPVDDTKEMRDIGIAQDLSATGRCTSSNPVQAESDFPIFKPPHAQTWAKFASDRPAWWTAGKDPIKFSRDAEAEKGRESAKSMLAADASNGGAFRRSILNQYSGAHSNGFDVGPGFLSAYLSEPIAGFV